MVAIMIFERLCALISEQFAISEDFITLETSFVDDLQVDSLDVAELIMALEEAFDIPEVDEETVIRLVTVGDVLSYISTYCD